MAYIKTFCKKCATKMKEDGKADELPEWRANIQEAVKAITSEFNEYCL